LLKPTSPLVDDTVRLLARVAVPSPGDPRVPQTGEALGLTTTSPPLLDGATGVEGRAYWLTAVSDAEEMSAQQRIRAHLDQGWYVYGEKTPGRKRLQVGDRLCFYETGVGVVAEAEVAGVPEYRALSLIPDAEQYPWSFHVTNVRYFFDTPVVIDARLRAQLEVFHGCDPSQSWGWFVQTMRAVTEIRQKTCTGQMNPRTRQWEGRYR
jgi:hypothetical protein